MITDEIDIIKKNIWIARDGRKIFMHDMSDNHLISTIIMIRRHLFNRVFELVWRRAAQACHYAKTAPNGAADAAIEYSNSIMSTEGFDDILMEVYPKFEELICEAQGRKLLSLSTQISLSKRN